MVLMFLKAYASVDSFVKSVIVDEIDEIMVM